MEYGKLPNCCMWTQDKDFIYLPIINVVKNLCD